MIDVTTTTTRVFHEQGISVEVTVKVKNDNTLDKSETVTFEIKDFDVKNGNPLAREKTERLQKLLAAAIAWDDTRKILAG